MQQCVRCDDNKKCHLKQECYGRFGGVAIQLQETTWGTSFLLQTAIYLIVPAPGLTLLLNPDHNGFKHNVFRFPFATILEKRSKIFLAISLQLTHRCVSTCCHVAKKGKASVGSATLFWSLGNYDWWVMGWRPCAICEKPKKLASPLLIRVSWSVTQRQASTVLRSYSC